MDTLKERIAGAEKAGVAEESPIAALFRSAKGLPVSAPANSEAVKDGSSASRLLELPADALEEMEQPFRLYNDAKMEQMRQSIVTHGVIQRIIVRPHPEKPGRYQIISGRHRRRGAMLAGYTMVPCEVRAVDDHEARLLMVELNLQQREKLLPSEKAWAYRIQLEELAHQGKRAEIEKFENGAYPLWDNEKRTCGTTCHKSRDEISTEDSGRTIQKYIRLTYLIPELLAAVDDESLPIGAGVSLSYLSETDQRTVYQYFFIDHKQRISGELAERLRSSGEKAPLTEERLQMILAPAVPVKKFRKVSLPMKPLREFFPATATAKDVERQIMEIVTKYFKEGRHEPKH